MLREDLPEKVKLTRNLRMDRRWLVLGSGRMF